MRKSQIATSVTCGMEHHDGVVDGCMIPLAEDMQVA